MEVIFALDAGTTSVRTLAFDQRLRVLDQAQRTLTQYYPAPGRVEQDPAEIVGAAVATLREVAVRQHALGNQVIALGVTNQRETTVGFDRESGRVLAPAIVWQDRRTAERCAELAAAGHEPGVRATTGLVLDPYFSATKMRWMLDRDLARGAREPSVATVDTWLVWNLTGAHEGGAYLTEPSNASRTLLLDLATLDWSDAMTSLFGVERSMLASVRPSSSHFGFVSGDVVPELAGVPITGVLGDQQAALFGQACFLPGQVKATYGTGAFVLVHAGAEAPRPIPGLLSTVAWDLGDRGPVSYALEGSAFVAGAAVQWLREVGLIGSEREIEALASSVEDPAGVSFVPALTGLGSPFWRPEARGAIVGLSRGSSRQTIARALVESLAFQVRAMTDAFAEAGVTVRELRADGGAAVMDLLLELQASSSGVPVSRGATVEATACGAAGVAGLAAGWWGTLEEIADLWHEQRRFAPGPSEPLASRYRAWRRAAERA